MRKNVVDYREFRLSRLNEPRFSHLKLLFGWVVYFILFYLTERFIPAESCHPVHMFLDDLIPFCEWFLIPYVFWYGLIVYSLWWFAWHNIHSFRRLQTYFIIVQLLATVCYVLYPTRQDLRPGAFENSNILTQGVAVLYAIDTNTGVCPSLHVACSVGIFSVWSKERGVHWGYKAFILVVSSLICLSTMFIKQHSAVDFFAALPVCLIAETIVYRDRYFGIKKHFL